WYSINSKIQYGFSDQQLRGQIQLTYNFNRTKFTRLRLTAGSWVAQLSDQDPVSPFWDTYSSLFFKNNFIRLYEKDFVHFHFRQEIVNGLFLRSSLEYARRRFLSNQTNHSWFFKSRLYDPNSFRSEGDPAIDFSDQEALIFKLSLRFRFKQKYLSYPQRKYIEGSDWPDFWIHYKKGIQGFGTESDFDQIRFNIKDELTFGILGFSSFNLEVGTFLRQEQLSFVDHQHFNGNRLGFAKVEDYYTSFLLLPYYQFSTSNSWFQGHYEHHFEGFLFDKIPLLRRWNLKSVLRASFLYTEDRKDYLELSFGLENLGFGALRVFRLDLVNAFWRGSHVQTGLVLGIDL
ncbi:MAG: DUF5686 family protein, partial [Bacteroidota bacterium]